MESGLYFISGHKTLTLKNNPQQKNTASPQFETGKVIKGKVIDTLTLSKYVLRVRGVDIIAESELPLQVGKVYSLQLQKTAGKANFRVIDPPKVFASIQEKVAYLINTSNVAANSVNQTIAFDLVNMNLPVNESNLANLLSYIATFSKNNDSKNLDKTDLTVLAIAHQLKLAPKKTNIELLRNVLFFSGNFDMKAGVTVRNDNSFDFPAGLLLSSTINSSGGSSENEQISVTVNEFLKNPLKLMLQLLNSDSEKIVLLRHFMSILQYFKLFENALLSNEKTTEILYYFPLVLPFREDIISIELFYQRAYELNDNMKNNTFFIIDLLIYVIRGAPVHIRISKKVEKMLRLDIFYDERTILETLKKDDIKLKTLFKALGYDLIKSHYELRNTADANYKTDLFFPQKSTVKTVNFTS